MNGMKPKRQQRGATLIVGLIFLVALTLLGVIAMKSTLLQERMAGGSRDHSLAFQAAEAVLRDAKRDIVSFRADGTECYQRGPNCRPAADRPVDRGINAGSTPFSPACTNGLCYDNPSDGYTFGAGPHTVFSMTAAPSVAYGTFTAAAAIAGVSAQPRYLIEIFTRGDPPRYFYRVTARAVGANPNTVVTLQEVFAP
jgi:type IV pilus assembly protein PilX